MGPAPGEVNLTAWSLTALITLPDTALRVGQHNLGGGKAEAGDFRASPHSVVHGVAHRGVRNKMSVVPGLLTRLGPWTLGHPGRWESRKSQEWKRTSSRGQAQIWEQGELWLSSAVIFLSLSEVMAGNTERSMGELSCSSVSKDLLHVPHGGGR